MSLHATLICTDEACAEEFEAWGEIEELDTLACEACGCALQPLAYGEAGPAPPRLPDVALADPTRDPLLVRLRDAA